MRLMEDQAAFGPEAIAGMVKAFDEACAALQVNGNQYDREAIAARIIDLARSGVVDPDVLRDHVVKAGR